MNKLILFLIPFYVFSMNSIENGGVFYIQNKAKSLTFNKTTYKPFIGDNFLIPIPYKIKKKIYSIQAKNSFMYLNIIEGKYKTDILKVKKSKTKLSKKTQNRTYKEFILIKKLYKQKIDKQFNTKFIYPLQSKLTSLYGNKRVFNNQIKSYHSGLDFRAKMGTEILSSNDGVVVFAGDLFYSGGSVIISHGLGLFTLYAHLSKVIVSKGDNVKKKDIIAYSGKSGRVSGPHLHFGVILNGVKINPTKAIKALNKIIKAEYG